MKKLFLALLFNLITLTAFGQDDFSVGDYGVSQVVNYNPWNEDVIEEKIIKRNKYTFITHLFNKRNGYSVKVKYKLKDKNNLICKFTGDLKKTVHLTRYKFDLNNKLKT